MRVAPPHVNLLFCVKYGVPVTRGKQNLTMLTFLIAPTDSHFSPGFYYIRHFAINLAIDRVSISVLNGIYWDPTWPLLVTVLAGLLN